MLTYDGGKGEYVNLNIIEQLGNVFPVQYEVVAGDSCLVLFWRLKNPVHLALKKATFFV